MASSSAHIAEPRRPRHLLGCDPINLKPEINRLGNAARDSAGRRLRPDAGLMVAGVISYPVPRAELATSDDWRTYLEWRNACVEWLTRQFRQSLRSIVEHEDEAFRHIHAFMLPDLAPDGQMNWALAHPARHARVTAAHKGENKTGQNAAYIAVVTALADDFHDSVSRHFGHSRITVRRDRRSRGHHLEIRTYQQRLEDATGQIVLLSRERDELLAALAERRTVLDNRVHESAEGILSHLAQRLDALPVGSRAAAEIEDLLQIAGGLRRLALAGHSEAMEVTESGPASSGSDQNYDPGDEGLALSDPPILGYRDWGDDDDPRPDLELDVDHHDDDPDPEAPSDADFPGDRDDDSDYGDHLERFEDVDREG